MSEILTLERLLWGFTFCLNLALVFLIVYRRNYRVFPFFFIYTLVDLLQGVILFGSQWLWGFNSTALFKIGWGTQSLVSVARTLAVVEICQRTLAKYRGIWALGWRIFLAMAGVVLAYCWVVGQHRWQLIPLTADRGLELAIAVAILALFLFISHYQVAIEPADRFLAIGFFLYSCFRALNDTVMERWLAQYVTLWKLLGTLAFLASLVLWMWAMRQTQERTPAEPELLPEDQYRVLSPAINARLRALNEQLGHFWHTEGKKT
jgi:hypothetical protein